MTTDLYWCRKCGMVRASDQAPWCRHFALDLPARRMVPLPASHPNYGDPVDRWRDEAIKK